MRKHWTVAKWEGPIFRLEMPNPLTSSDFLPLRKRWPHAGGSNDRPSQIGWLRRNKSNEGVKGVSLFPAGANQLLAEVCTPGPRQLASRKGGWVGKSQRRLTFYSMPSWPQERWATLIIKISDSIAVSEHNAGFLWPLRGGLVLWEGQRPKMTRSHLVLKKIIGKNPQTFRMKNSKHIQSRQQSKMNPQVPKSPSFKGCQLIAKLVSSTAKPQKTLE